MAGKLITERVGVNGDVSYLVRIREGGVKANKTFKAKKEGLCCINTPEAGNLAV